MKVQKRGGGINSGSELLYTNANVSTVSTSAFVYYLRLYGCFSLFHILSRGLLLLLLVPRILTSNILEIIFGSQQWLVLNTAAVFDKVRIEIRQPIANLRFHSATAAALQEISQVEAGASGKWRASIESLK